MLNDPAKLLPLIIAIGGIVCIIMGKTEEGMLLLGGAQVAHAGISAVNNPPK